MDLAALVATSSTSGVNAYLTVLILGVAGRLGWATTPDALQEGWVLAATTVLFLVEFVVDKVPLLDSAWDVVHTAVRPTVAAMVAASFTGVEIGQPWASLLAAGLAFTGHASKATARLAINASPEPFSNIVASVTEDGLVAAIVVLALTAPRFAAGAALVLLAAGAVAAFLLLRIARTGLAALRRTVTSRHRAERERPPA